MARANPTSPAHTKKLHGLCPACGHYGSDCTGSEASAHTAGPWFADLVDLQISTADQTKIAVVHQQIEPSEDSDVTSANALLLAAAPELLDVLQAISNDCERWVSGNEDMSAEDLFAAFKSEADKAIAKAHGR